MRTSLLFALSVLTAATLTGCGGGGSGSTGLSSDTGQQFSFGSLSGRAARTNPPVLTNASGVSAVGLTGSIQSLELRDVSKNLANTKIVFSSDREGSNDIFVEKPDGTGQQNLTRIKGGNVQPAYSPDLTKIAFSSQRGGSQQIFAMNANGSSQKNLTNNSADNAAPAWTPDGTKIFFSSNLPGFVAIFVMNADGSGQLKLTNNVGNDFAPAVSPDGTKVAFGSQRDGDNEIYVMNPDGTNQVDLTNNLASDFGASWSPDGTKIAFASDRDGNNEIYVMNADGSNQHNLTNNSHSDSQPTWSPDGLKIAFTSDRDGNNNIYVMNADGSSQARLTSSTGNDQSPSWSQFPSRRKLIGAGGQMGATAAGFVYAQSGDAVPASIVTFGAANFTALLLTSPTGNNNTGAALVYDLEGGDASITLSDLRYWNLSDPLPMQVLPTSGLTANGALISFGAQTGFVRSILPFTAPTRASGTASRPKLTEENGVRVVRGQFLGVWNDQGKNLAPHGAQEVRLDSQTGAVISVK